MTEIDLNNNGKGDFDEIVDGFKQFLSDAEKLDVSALTQDIQNAGVWLNGEINGLSTLAQNFLSASIAKAKAETTSLDDAVSRTLTLAYDDVLHTAVGLETSVTTELKSLSSDAIASAVGLLSKAPTA